MGYFYTTGTNTQSASLTTFSQTIYSPNTGVAGNFLTPGIYTVSTYLVIYSEGSSTCNVGITVGILANSSANPTTAGGSAAVTPIVTSANLSTVNNVAGFFPTFTFTVTTSGYYYSYIQTASSGSLTGTYVLLARTLSILRVG